MDNTVIDKVIVKLHDLRSKPQSSNHYWERLMLLAKDMEKILTDTKNSFDITTNNFKLSSYTLPYLEFLRDCKLVQLKDYFEPNEKEYFSIIYPKDIVTFPNGATIKLSFNEILSNTDNIKIFLKKLKVMSYVLPKTALYYTELIKYKYNYEPNYFLNKYGGSNDDIGYFTTILQDRCDESILELLIRRVGFKYIDPKYNNIIKDINNIVERKKHLTDNKLILRYDRYHKFIFANMMKYMKYVLSMGEKNIYYPIPWVIYGMMKYTQYDFTKDKLDDNGMFTLIEKYNSMLNYSYKIDAINELNPLEIDLTYLKNIDIINDDVRKFIIDEFKNRRAITNEYININIKLSYGTNDVCDNIIATIEKTNEYFNTIDVVMKTGDVLFIPAQMYHVCEPNSARLSISIPLWPKENESVQQLDRTVYKINRTI